MKNGKFSLPKTISLLSILMMLATGCGPALTEVPTEPPAATTEPTEPPAQLPQTPPWLSLICPETDPLPPDDPAFQPVFGEVTLEGEFFIRAGTYTNKNGQVFDITVRGTDQEVVQIYTDALRVCMELLDLKEPDFETDVPDETAAEDIIEDEVLKQNPENLEIVTNPSPQTTEGFQNGYIWVFVIDPSIANTATHDYRKFCRDSATTRVDVGATGSVSATHYRRPPGGSNNSSTSSVGPGAYARWIYSGRATYDLRVVGSSAGNTKYRVSGTVWNFSDTAGAPSGGGTDCPA